LPFVPIEGPAYAPGRHSRRDRKRVRPIASLAIVPASSQRSDSSQICIPSSLFATVAIRRQQFRRKYNPAAYLRKNSTPPASLNQPHSIDSKPYGIRLEFRMPAIQMA
jgi:hypothetical protein